MKTLNEYFMVEISEIDVGGKLVVIAGKRFEQRQICFRLVHFCPVYPLQQVKTL